MGDGSKSDAVRGGIERAGGSVAAGVAAATATTPLAAVGAAAGLAQALASVAGPLLEKRREERARNFLARVAHYLATEDPEAAARFAAGEAETEAFADTLERGYEQIRRAFDPLARECLCLLVAQHALAPDPVSQRGDFVTVGALLERSDEAGLAAADTVASLLATFPVEQPGRVVLFVTRAPAGVFLWTERGAPDRRWTGVKHMRAEVRRSLLSSLAAAGLGFHHTGTGGAPPKGAPQEDASSDFEFTARDAGRMLLLHRCLAPVRVRPASSSSGSP